MWRLRIRLHVHGVVHIRVKVATDSQCKLVGPSRFKTVTYSHSDPANACRLIELIAMTHAKSEFHASFVIFIVHRSVVKYYIVMDILIAHFRPLRASRGVNLCGRSQAVC